MGMKENFLTHDSNSMFFVLILDDESKDGFPQSQPTSFIPLTHSGDTEKSLKEKMRAAEKAWQVME
jgi:hypothetical protein